MELEQTGFHIELVDLHIVNRSLAEVIRIWHVADENEKPPNKVFFYKDNPTDRFENIHLLPFGGGIWVLLKMYPFEKLSKPIQFKFNFDRPNDMETPEFTIDVTMSPEDNRSGEDYFAYRMEYRTRFILGENERHHVLEIIIDNSAKLLKIIEAGNFFKMGTNLFGEDNNEDAEEQIGLGKCLLKDVDEDKGGDLMDRFEKEDAKMYWDTARDHLQQYFDADSKKDKQRAITELDLGLTNAEKACNIDPDNEDYQKLFKFTQELSYSVFEFEKGRKDLADAYNLEQLNNLEYATYYCDYAIDKFTRVKNRLDQWDIASLKIPEVDQSCLEKYSEKLEWATEYFAELTPLYRQERDLANDVEENLF